MLVMTAWAKAAVTEDLEYQTLRCIHQVALLYEVCQRSNTNHTCRATSAYNRLVLLSFRCKR